MCWWYTAKISNLGWSNLITDTVDFFLEVFWWHFWDLIGESVSAVLGFEASKFPFPVQSLSHHAACEYYIEYILRDENKKYHNIRIL